MNKETMWEAMEHLAPDLIEEADYPAAPRRRRSWGKTLLIAAAACLVLAVGVVAADALFGFHFLYFENDGESNRYGLTADTTKFPAEQFGETVQEYMENGMPVLDRRPADYAAEGTEAEVVTLDVPSFDTWEEAADFIGEDIPLAAESSVLAAGKHREFDVFVTGDCASLSTVYTLDGYDIMVHVNIDAEGGGGYETGAFLGEGNLSIQQLEMTTGSGDGALVYLTTGERPSCDAYFIHEGVYYNIFIVDAEDTALMEEILASF